MKLTKAQRETLAVLNAMHASANAAEGTPESKAAAGAMYAAHGGAEIHDTLKASAAAEDDDDEKAKAAAKDEEDPAPPTSKSPAAATAATQAATVAVAASAAAAVKNEAASVEAFAKEMAARADAVEKQVAALRAERRADDVERILASRPDLTSHMRASLRRLGSPSKVKDFVDGIPLPTVKTTAVVPGTATRGETQGTGAAGRDPNARAEVRAALNIPVPAETAGWSKPHRGLFVLTSMTPSEARARAQAGKKGS